MNWGNAIVIVREKEGLTQDQLSKAAGISRVALSAIENNRSRPSEENLKNIATALKTDVGFITLMAINPETDMSEESRAKFYKLFPDFHERLLSFLK